MLQSFWFPLPLLNRKSLLQGWDLLLTLLRHPRIAAGAAAFRQQRPELIDAPEDRRTPPSPKSVQDQAIHQKEGGHTPSTPAGTWTEPLLPVELGLRSSEGDQVGRPETGQDVFYGITRSDFASFCKAKGFRREQLLLNVSLPRVEWFHLFGYDVGLFGRSGMHST